MSRFVLASSCILALLVVACGGSTPEETRSTVATVGQHMNEHFAQVREVEDAVMRGDLEAAAGPARSLLEHQEVPGLPPGTLKYVVDMRNSAMGVTSTDNVGNAAVATATMVATCGQCHAASGATPKMPAVTPSAPAEGVASHMRDHEYAINLLGEGLIGPSDTLWREGAEALKAAPLVATDFPEVPANIAASAARVHELADRALTATDTGARVAIYGELIGSCAACHGLHGKVWGPGLPKGD